MRQVMRIGHEFEQWAREHVEFDHLEEVWPYMLGDRFGSACLGVLPPTELGSFAEHDCIPVAFRLGLPLRNGSNVSPPIDVTAGNPVRSAGFKAFRIQTVRASNEDQSVVPFTPEDDPLGTNSVLRSLQSTESTTTTGWNTFPIETLIATPSKP
jgi:hypothetical protein